MVLVKITESNGELPLKMSLCLPLRPDRLLYLVERDLTIISGRRGFTLPKVKSIKLVRYSVRWLTLNEADVIPGSRYPSVIKVRPRSAKKPRSAGSASAAAPLADAEPDGRAGADAEGGAHDVEVELEGGDADVLERMLGEIIEEAAGKHPIALNL